MGGGQIHILPWAQSVLGTALIPTHDPTNCPRTKTLTTASPATNKPSYHHQPGSSSLTLGQMLMHVMP